MRHTRNDENHTNQRGYAAAELCRHAVLRIDCHSTTTVLIIKTLTVGTELLSFSKNNSESFATGTNHADWRHHNDA